MSIKHPDLPFVITDSGTLRYPNGLEKPASPEILVMGALLVSVTELKGVMNEFLENIKTAPTVVAAIKK